MTPHNVWRNCDEYFDNTLARRYGGTPQKLARSRGLSTNKLMEELSAHALAAWDTENRFRALAATGDAGQALAILDRLDSADERA